MFLSKSKPDLRSFAPFVGFEGFQQGTWIGLAYGGLHNGQQTFSVLSYRRGHRIRRLMRTSLDYGAPRTDVTAVGVLPDQTVIATADVSPWFRPLGYPPAKSWVLHDGRRTALRAPRSWWAVVARAVTDDGRIVGLGMSGSHDRPTVHAVTWAHPTAWPRTVPGITGAWAAGLVADRSGDIAWVAKNDIGKVRLNDGQVRVLADPGATGLAPGEGVEPQLAQGHMLWSNAGQNGMLRWNLLSVPARGPIEGTTVTEHDDRGNRWPDAASTAGTLVDGLKPNHRTIYLPGGQQRQLPLELNSDGDALNAVDGDTVAYISARDHLPHFDTCRV